MHKSQPFPNKTIVVAYYLFLSISPPLEILANVDEKKTKFDVMENKFSIEGLLYYSIATIIFFYARSEKKNLQVIDMIETEFNSFSVCLI